MQRLRAWGCAQLHTQERHLHSHLNIFHDISIYIGVSVLIKDICTANIFNDVSINTGASVLIKVYLQLHMGKNSSTATKLPNSPTMCISVE